MREYNRLPPFPSPIEDLDYEFHVLLDEREETLAQWGKSGEQAKLAIIHVVRKIEDRILNIFKRVLDMGYSLDKDMRSFEKYNFDSKLTGYEYPEKSVTKIQIKNIVTPLKYSEVEPLLIKLKNDNYKPNEEDKKMMSHKSFKSQRSRFITNEKMKKEFSNILEAIMSYEQQRIPLRVFYDMLKSPSKYFQDVLRESFIKNCNMKSGKLYKKCNSQNIKIFEKAKNIQTGEWEQHIGLK